jgi:hypothetical protein
MEEVLQAFIKQAPVAVMMRAAVTRAINDSALDQLFERSAQTQYTKEVTFSTLVKLLAQVTLGTYDTVHQAYRHAKDVPVSVTAIYDKLKGVEPCVVEALVHQTAQNLNEVMKTLPLPATEASPGLPGLKVRQLDGNFLAGTEHRLECLRGSGAAALPGMSLVVRDAQTGLLTDMIACEDAYQSERSLYDRLLPLVERDDLWVADCNFCTLDYLQGIAGREGYFLIRRHGGTKLTPLTERRYVGSNETGDIYEQKVLASGKLTCRCIIIELFEPLRDGSKELRLLTNVPARKGSAKRLAALYRQRWEIETAFQELTCNLCCEVNTLGYPKAALFAFGLALLAYNAVKVVQSAIAAGQNKEIDELSTFHMATEIATVCTGMSIALPEACWAIFAKMSNRQFAKWLHKTACELDARIYRKNKRGPQKPPEVQRTRRGAHRSTARVLKQAASVP